MRLRCRAELKWWLSAVCLIVTGVWSAGGLHGEDARQQVQTATGTAGMVVSESAEASQVGADVLAEGGNAVDAAIATAFALAVTWPEAGNIGGGGFMLVAPPQQDVVCIEYRETAPMSVTPYTFAEDTILHHPRIVGVPGTVRGMQKAHDQFGTMPWRNLVLPAVGLAREGVTVSPQLAGSLNGVLSQQNAQTDPLYSELRRVFGHPDGRPWKAGDHLVQPELAATLQLIADDGPDAFYTGRIAAQIVVEMDRHDGLMTLEDLRRYQANVRPAVSGMFQEYRVFGAPPPSSGGLTVLLQLAMLEEMNLPTAAEHPWTVAQVHGFAEAMRRSFRERAASLGDPAFAPIPSDYLDTDRVSQLVTSFDPAKATPSTLIAGDIPLTPGPEESPETTHFSVVDRNGMAVSNTYTLEHSYGSRIVVPGAGFLLNNEMGDFNWVPGRTDRKGRIGTSANLVAPGKRMLSSQSPTIVRRDGRTVLATGSPGGRTIINTVSGILVQTLLFDRPLAEAVAAPRLHQQWFPDELRIETVDADWFEELVADLKSRGHHVRPVTRQGSAHSIAIDLESGQITGVADWRRGGRAVAADGE